jgi:putative heme-binding domain-containing protein
LSENVRAQVAANLVGIRATDPSIIPAVASLLGGNGNSEALQKRIVDILGSAPEGGRALVEVFTKLPNNLIEPAFGHIIKREASTSAFLELLANKTISLTTLGPARTHRLRTHGDQNVAKRANEVIDSLAGPEQKEKDALLAKYRPEVVKPGDVSKGKASFTANCAGCHQFKGEGRNLAPNLTGMGAHGPEDLLVHILDPNRVVEANFLSFLIETKDGTSYTGIIERENASELVLRDASADHTIRLSDIKERTNTGKSLMPEGFEALGADGLRDLLAYLCADENRFRILDLTRAFTANNSRGLFISPENLDETVTFNRYGLRKAEDVPFDVISPDKAAANVIVLRGGAPDSWSKTTLPGRVNVKVGVAARRLHFLSGVAGWGAPLNPGVNAAKVTVHYAGGATQELVMKNGTEFADYNGRPEVPGSKGLNWTKGRGQIRWFSRELNNRAVVESLTLESYDNGVAPIFFAITADTAEAAPGAGAGAGASTTPAAPPQVQWDSGLKTLIVGGGSSHDFGRFFGLADTRTLNSFGKATANYLEPVPGLASVIQAADVLYLSNNQAFADDASRAAVFAHVNAGKGLVLVHPSLWYNWQNEWPEYNRQLVGGGSRGHDPYGEFEVTVIAPDHPLMKGVPAKFTLSDELYYFEADAAGTPIQVLATAYSKRKNKTFPQVFVVQHPKTRIAGITLGHDGVAHSHPAYQQLLKNAVLWSAKADAP